MNQIKNKTSGLAVAALVFAFLGLAFVASIIGHGALSDIKRNGTSGRSLAITAIILGYLQTLFLTVLLVLSATNPDIFNYIFTGRWLLEAYGHFYCSGSGTKLGCPN